MTSAAAPVRTPVNSASFLIANRGLETPPSHSKHTTAHESNREKLRDAPTNKHTCEMMFGSGAKKRLIATFTKLRIHSTRSKRGIKQISNRNKNSLCPFQLHFAPLRCGGRSLPVCGPFATPRRCNCRRTCIGLCVLYRSLPGRWRIRANSRSAKFASATTRHCSLSPALA